MLSEKPWNLARLVHLVLCILFCVYAVVLAQWFVTHLAAKQKLAEGSLLYLVFGSLALHGSILMGTAFVLWQHRLKWRETFGFNTPPLGTAVLLGLATALVFLPAGMVLQDVSLRIMEKIHFQPETQQAIMEFEKANSLASRAYLIFFAVVFAPVAEEVFFRGTLYPVIKQAGYPRIALWGSSVIFAAIHKTPAIFLPLVLLSLLLVWLYEKTDNLLAPITAHAVFNGVNVALLYFSDSLMDALHRVFHHFQ